MKSYAEQVIDRYVEDNMENSHCIGIEDLPPYGLQSYFFDELDKIEVKGFPVGCDFVSPEGETLTLSDYRKRIKEVGGKCRLRYHYLPKYHELYIGTTGSGKTTCCMEPDLRALAAQKNKPNLFVTDPKGELFAHNARYLQSKGYRTFVLNFKDFSRSDRWNPLEEIYDMQEELLHCGEKVETRTGPLDRNLSLVATAEKYKETYLVYKRHAFPDETFLDRYLMTERSMIQSSVASLINQLATILIPSSNSSDPGWENGARSLCAGILMLMTAQIGKPDFKRSMMTLRTVNELYSIFRRAYNGDDDEAQDKIQEMLKNTSPEVANKLNIVLQAHPNGRKGYLSTFQSAIAQWMQGHIHFLTSDTTINVDGDDPFAVFICTRDYDKSDFPIAALFVDWIYRKALKAAEKAPRNENNEPLTRDLHLLLDEFGNIPKIPSFETKIATARSRKIWFHLFIQTYDQLDNVYGAATAAVIIDNCNQQLFLGAQAETTKERFSKECGLKTIPEVANLFGRDNINLISVPVVSLTDLDAVSAGRAYVKRIYVPTFRSTSIPSYVSAAEGVFENFEDPSAFLECAPLNDVLPYDRDHCYPPFSPSSFFSTEEGEDDD